MERLISKKIVLRFGFFLLLALFVSSVNAGSKDTIEKKFNVQPGGKLLLESDKGSVEISTTDRDVVEVTVYKDSRWGDDDDLKDFEVRFNQRGNDVEIIGEFLRKSSGFFGNRHNKIRIRYVIVVPREYNIEAKTSGGSIEVEDIKGDVFCKTSGGSLNFGDIKGEVTGRTSGGSITLDGCEGNAEIKTSGGSISIGDVNGEVTAKTSGGSISIDRAKGSVYARTSGGSIRVDEVFGSIDASTSGGSVRAKIAEQPKDDCRLSTSGGSVIVYLASDIKVDLDAHTSGGRVRTEFPVTVRGTIKRNSLDAKINGGGPEMYLRTSGGNVEIKEL
ncbi:MAG: hypothetical protein DWQ05_02820 [Calditrichaeota bacterium]|nr:MAG: hypothetical protein DWQ05_02820 [Calditrichota bacterium]